MRWYIWMSTIQLHEKVRYQERYRGLLWKAGAWVQFSGSPAFISPRKWPTDIKIRRNKPISARETSNGRHLHVRLHFSVSTSRVSQDRRQSEQEWRQTICTCFFICEETNHYGSKSRGLMKFRVRIKNIHVEVSLAPTKCPWEHTNWQKSTSKDQRTGSLQTYT